MRKSFKLQFRNPHYKTVKDTDQKSVICSIECSLYLPLPVTRRIAEKYKEKATFSYVPSNSNVIACVAEIEVEAVSKCHPEDTFVFETGKHLSESRAKGKAYRLSRNIIGDLVEDYSVDHFDSNGKTIPSPITVAKDMCYKLSAYYEDELSHVAKLEH